MTAVVDGLKRLVIPDSEALIDGGARPELMALFNDMNRRLDLIAAAQQPEQDPPTVRQIQVGTTSTSVSTAEIIPLDNTKPQITEGAEAQAFSFTPLITDSKLLVEWTGRLSVAAGSFAIAAMFVSGTSDAFVSAYFNNAGTGATGTGTLPNQIVLRGVVDSWGITAKTVSVRIGTNNGTNATLFPTTSVLNGTALSVLTVTEYKNPA